MKFIKNFAVFVLFIMLSVSSVCFAEDGVVTQNATGDWVYETTIGSLVNRRIREEIKLINNSSYPLTHVTCTVTINGKNHDMRPMPVLKLSDSEGFDGYYEDDMYQEFPRYFGKDGRFSRNNNNVVTFTFRFRDHSDSVMITDVYDSEDDLCFVVSDSAYTPQVRQPVPAAAPAVVPAKPSVVPAQQNVAPQNNASGDTTVVIDGKTYLLHDGKAYQIQ